jgi:hypothetical protein
LHIILFNFLGCKIKALLLIRKSPAYVDVFDGVHALLFLFNFEPEKKADIKLSLEEKGLSIKVECFFSLIPSFSHLLRAVLPNINIFSNENTYF